jgi:nucleoside-diphosphate-sugar epimerase
VKTRRVRRHSQRRQALLLPNSMAHLFVTGAAGWLGLNLLEFLRGPKIGATGLEFDGITAFLHPQDSEAAVRAIVPDARIVRGDVRDPAAVDELFRDAKGGTVIHTAGIIHPRRVREFYEVNRDGTRHVLEAAARSGVRRVVAVSSNSPCGCNPHHDHRFDEKSPYRPYMHYGKSKMEMERIVGAFHERGELETVIIRAPWFYGPHQPPRQRLFFEMIRDGKAPLVGGGANVRSMAYTGNLAQGLALAAAKPVAAGQIYWIADRRAYSMNEIIDTIERLLESEFGQTCAHRRMRLPGLMSEVAWAIDWCVQAMGLYHQKIHVLSEMNKSIACSMDKAVQELGYQPEISLEEGMRRSLAEVFPVTVSSR